MKISVITAVHNGARTIAATLDSVSDQDYPNIEHIVVDGASGDGTASIVTSRRSRVSRLISEPDSGVYDAFNKGLRAASGDVVAYLNSGDIYASNRVASQMADVVGRDGIEAAFGDVMITDESDYSLTVRRYSSRRFTPRSMTMGIMPAHPTLFLRREIYRRVGEYDPSYRIAGDFELCLRVFAKRSARYQYVPEALVRMPRGGLSNRGWRSKWAITREMHRACRQNGVSTNFLKLSMRFPLKLSEMIW